MTIYICDGAWEKGPIGSDGQNLDFVCFVPLRV